MTYTNSSKKHLNDFIFQQAKTEIILSVLSVLIVSVLIWDQLANERIIGWSVLCVGAGMARFSLVVSYGKANDHESIKWFGTFALLILASGVLWGFAMSELIQQASLFNQAFALVTLCCLLSLFIAVYSGVITLFMLFSLPAVIIPGITLLQNGSDVTNHIAILLIAFALFQFVLALSHRNFFLGTLQLRTENNDLKDKLRQTADSEKKINIALKTTTDKNAEAERQLEIASSSLGDYKNKIQSLLHLLKTTSHTCSITELANYRYFNEIMNKEWNRAMRDMKPLSLAYIRIDDFANIENASDKKTTQAFLKVTGQLIKGFGRRPGDLAAYLDKGHFAFLLPGADTVNSARIIHEIHGSISHLQLENKASNSGYISVHGGVATLIPDRNSSTDKLIERVESALYEAEFQGGNQIINFKAFSDLNIQSWNQLKDGQYNEAAFQQKLLSQGFDIIRKTLPLSTQYSDKKLSTPKLFAIFSGGLRFIIEGQPVELRRGFSMILPPDLTFSMEVIDDAAILYTEE